jgi:chromosome segregation ATPase
MQHIALLVASVALAAFVIAHWPQGGGSGGTAGLLRLPHLGAAAPCPEAAARPPEELTAASWRALLEALGAPTASGPDGEGVGEGGGGVSAVDEARSLASKRLAAARQRGEELLARLERLQAARDALRAALRRLAEREAALGQRREADASQQRRREHAAREVAAQRGKFRALLLQLEALARDIAAATKGRDAARSAALAAERTQEEAAAAVEQSRAHVASARDAVEAARAAVAAARREVEGRVAAATAKRAAAEQLNAPEPPEAAALEQTSRELSSKLALLSEARRALSDENARREAAEREAANVAQSIGDLERLDKLGDRALNASQLVEALRRELSELKLELEALDARERQRRGEPAGGSGSGDALLRSAEDFQRRQKAAAIAAAEARLAVVDQLRVAAPTDADAGSEGRGLLAHLRERQEELRAAAREREAEAARWAARERELEASTQRLTAERAELQRLVATAAQRRADLLREAEAAEASVSEQRSALAAAEEVLGARQAALREAEEAHATASKRAESVREAAATSAKALRTAEADARVLAGTFERLIADNREAVRAAAAERVCAEASVTRGSAAPDKTESALLDAEGAAAAEVERAADALHALLQQI